MIDVCLLLEGTYPYVSGGVSTWVHQLISAMKDIRFGIVYIAPHSDPTRTVKYDVPNHVLYLKEINLHDYELEKNRATSPREKDFEIVKKFYEKLVKEDYTLFPEFLELFRGEKSCLDIETVFSAKQTWDLLIDFYASLAPKISFVDFFWTWRGTHLPIIQVLKSELPPAKIYHAVSTGYAGLLGVIAKLTTQEKFFLTEHGIYTHERVLEISQANWIYEQEKRHYRAERELSFFKQWWVSIFKIMSHLSYEYADQLFTLYEGNRVRQVLEGADAEKISIIPNGIDIKSFETIVKEKRERPQVGLIGRVVPIKDVKTYIQAAKLVLEKNSEVDFYIIGPTDEEEEYYEECQAMVESMGVEDKIKFTGRVDIFDYYQFLDVVVLTSLSEAQPYVILEANVLGIPVVATDVGACRELLEGRIQEDCALGKSGLLTEVAHPQSTAKAILRLIENEELYQMCAEAGRKRVRQYYDQDDLLSRYLNVYERNL